MGNLHLQRIALARSVKLRIVPTTLREANALVSRWHRHHKPTVGHRFAVGVAREGTLVGAAIVGNPVARGSAQADHYIIEVTRLVTDGAKNACSMLYAAAARAAEAMGYDKIQTYILDSELGTSLKAAGWELEAMTKGGDWNQRGSEQQTFWGDAGRRTDQPMGPKQRWVKWLRKAA